MYSIERELASAGCSPVAGVDEAGRGPLAGPVVAAAVVLDPGNPVAGLDDSKKLTPRQREALLPEILAKALAVSLAAAGPREIERINILQASLRAMAAAVGGLRPAPAHVLVDGNRRIPTLLPQTPLVKGDSRCACIAAASVVAKVYRDRLMARMDGRYPGYGFGKHKGYPTRDHLAALERFGPCRIHRRTFRSVPAPAGA
ncbi:MAG: ribonuclease HII [Nitrospinae bacterium]|nr:ribonuclease HII [Nitrospinota bacterium]